MKVSSIFGSTSAVLLLLLMAASMHTTKAQTWKEIKKGLYVIVDEDSAPTVTPLTAVATQATAMGRGRKPRRNATVTYTFGWASIKVDPKEGARSCKAACNAYGLAPVGEGTNYLCAWNSSNAALSGKKTSQCSEASVSPPSCHVDPS